ncbi:M42 family metallopeptidase [Mycoplasmopsis felis]|uniref:M42 family metallopeptidase n=1 Tax=Mycoplasmopsis felis TaxID=33923 RepID=UPI002AFFB359|nr:M42 family metallopeptidase [Mycoplasmopsis felis]WQQ07350.1 M42 family metallopeptidase [Mycoplasmopsis felis]WQQ07425.1 M42 family metallopeptidase [Mycoplasmopsis felis]WQQ10523.1 M42 family metallopeptidase [Mycoplasmopsis felis]
MENKYKDLIKRLDCYMSIEAISRFEEPVVDELKKNINSSKFEVFRDKLGSVIFYKKSSSKNAPKIMIAAHMDEVGYMVRIIKDNGNIMVSPIGGVWASTVIGTKAVVVSSKTNKSYYGVFGHTSIHIQTPEENKSAMKNDDLYVDLGFKSKEEVQNADIEIGDKIFISGETLLLANNLIGGKAMDNRAGVTSLEFIAKNIENLNLECDVYLVGTVQEEVGTRGAKTSVSLIKPDIAFALDTGASHDTTGAKVGTPVCGNGVSILVKDGGTLPDPKLINYLMKLSKEKNIPAYKYIAGGGGTDAAELQFGEGGASVVTISIPQRYLHSPIGVASLVDIQAAIDLLTEFIKNYSSEIHDKELSYK